MFLSLPLTGGRKVKYLLYFSLLVNLAIIGFWGRKMYRAYEARALQASIIEHNKWNGYDIVEFGFRGVIARVVIPENADPNRNWIWRTQFWDVEPQVDIALLEKGFHVAFVEVQGLYGSPTAVNRLNDFYTFIVKNFNLNEKVVLEGLSRGGLDAFNWASINTDKVLCIYADAPVIDLKSWPLGRGKGVGSVDDSRLAAEAYQMTEEELAQITETPLYNCVKLAEARIPLLHVCGDEDEVVPFDENTLLLEKKFKEAGGEIKIIVKPGGKHHPHSLKDPQPIVDFILEKATKNSVIAASL